MQTTAGSLALAGSYPPQDATVAAKLRAAGALILGKTNLSEWANFRSTRSTSGWSARGGQTRHAYVLDVAAAEAAGRSRRWRLDKAFHVSPFMPMDMDYDWRFDEPGASLNVHMENLLRGERVFEATLQLRREPISARSLNLALLSFPLMTLRVAAAIYWQALRLLLKRVPFFTHPAKAGARDGATTRTSP